MLTLQWDKDMAMKARFDDGFNNGIESIALKMINRGKSFEDIHADTDLPLEHIKKLAVSINS